jgi:hypothetical protein
MLRSTPPVLTSTIWIAASEFFRNEVLLQSYWSQHYDALSAAWIIVRFSPDLEA